MEVYSMRKDPIALPWEEPDILGDLIASHETQLRTMGFYGCEMELEEVDIHKEFLEAVKGPAMKEFMNIIKGTST